MHSACALSARLSFAASGSCDLHLFAGVDHVVVPLPQRVVPVVEYLFRSHIHDESASPMHHAISDKEIARRLGWEIRAAARVRQYVRHSRRAIAEECTKSGVSYELFSGFISSRRGSGYCVDPRATIAIGERQFPDAGGQI